MRLILQKFLTLCLCTNFLCPPLYAHRVEVFARHCHYSEVSKDKARPSFFSREACFHNLMNTLDPSIVNITFFLDTFYPAKEEHFVKKQDKYNVIEISEGTEAGSFLKLIDHISGLQLDPETIVYIVEDDYLHRPGWSSILLEGFAIPGISYVTLYDHSDKYFLPMYDSLTSKIYTTPSCHWRTTPSTTNTYAMKYSTLQRDLTYHREYSLGRKITNDHGKFCDLATHGHILISSIPGWSTHMEPICFSPCIDWQKVQQEAVQ